MNDRTSARRSTLVRLAGAALMFAARAKSNDAATDTGAAASASPTATIEK